jgi:hypothetical protein
MLVGYPPFQADDPLDVLNQHISEDPVPPNAEINVPLPRDLEDVIMKCLAKSPENRYQLTDELLKALPTKQTINLSKLARRAKAQKKSMEARAEAGTSPVGLQESSHQSHAPIPNVHLDLEEFPVNTPYLFCTNGEDQGNVVSLREELAIGRNPKNDFALPDTSVSRYHAVVKHEENAFFVYDLNSGAGTYVDGVRIRRSGALRSGFIVQVGGVKLEFVNRDGPFFVHKRSHKLHRLSCHYVDESNLENLIYFARREVAISSGGIPCTVCNP